jgi:HAMP domain-containing protein
MKLSVLYTIKAKLTLIAVGITLILVCIGAVSYHYLDLIMQFGKLNSELNNFSKNISELRNAEKNFLIIDVKSDYFYHTGKSESLDKFSRHYTFTRQSIQSLEKNVISSDVSIKENLKTIDDLLQDYEKYTISISKSIRNRGFAEFGLLGDLQTLMTSQENKLKEIPENLQLVDNLLLISSYLKDFLEKKDLIYKDKLYASITNYKQLLENKGIDNLKLSLILNEIENYRSTFEKLVAKEVEIGLKTDLGLSGKIQDVSMKIEQIQTALVDSIEKDNSKAVNQAKNSLMIFISLLALLIIGLSVAVSKSVLQPLSRLRNYISEMVKGKMPEMIELQTKDEFEDLATSLNSFVENLKEKVHFSSEIGCGNLKVNYTPVGNEDILGSALLQMQENLLNAEAQDLQRKSEESKRTWTAVGLSKFGDILREHTNDLSELSFKLISELTNYLETSQCGLFLYNSDNQDDIHLELIAAYAYNRERKLKKKIRLKEGIVGVCAVEKATSLTDNVPDDYFKIRSGLGQAKPRYILTVPLLLNENLFGVIEIASFNQIEDYKIKFVEKLGENIASTYSTIKSNQRTAELLELARRQAEGITSQEEELNRNLKILANTKEELNKQRKEREEIATRLREKEEEVFNEIMKINEIEAKYSSLDETYKVNLAELQQNRESLHSLQEELHSQEEENATIHRKLKETEKLWQQSSNQIKELEDELQQKKTEISLTKEQIDRVIATDKARLQKQIDEHKKQIATLTEKSKNAEHELKLQINELKEEIEWLKSK